MPKIQVLDDETISQIAAGEVIERPVSVVKELVENSLDAGAQHIAVELIDGGRDAISVSDDGAGIPRSELALSLARHATSKLHDAHDLFSIRSLGFRGEGLASIAAAGTLEITSRTHADVVGARIEARGTWVGAPESAPASVGTKAVVRGLFSATPARRQFLKSGRAEFARVAEFLHHIALGWPRVGFSLRHDGRDVWTLAPVSDPIDRLEAVFGPDARGALLAIDPSEERGRERVGGFTCKAGRDRPNRHSQVFFVNGRLVKSAALGAAWLAGYASFGMTGRYPYGALMIEVPPQDVDVNVHPTKVEVRFAQAQAVFDAVRRAVIRTMRGNVPAPSATPPMPNAERAITAAGESAAQISFAPPPDESKVRVFGQVDNTFIVAGDGAEIIVIDQHAAHERIAYEAIVDSAESKRANAAMLFPATYELTPARAAVLLDHQEELAAAGIEVEPFGEGAFRLTAVWSGYGRTHFDLNGLLDDLQSDDAPREGIAKRSRVLATIACHSVVRAGDPLSAAEQFSLYERLLRCRDPQTCPHGRPTMLRFNREALAKAFKRS